jgi:hypothetical protein
MTHYVQKGGSYHIISFERNNKMRIKKHDELRQNRLSKIFFHNPTFFDTCKQTKTKVGDVVGCIFFIIYLFIIVDG